MMGGCCDEWFQRRAPDLNLWPQNVCFLRRPQALGLNYPMRKVALDLDNNDQHPQIKLKHSTSIPDTQSFIHNSHSFSLRIACM